MCGVSPRIIGKVECHQSEVIQMVLPNVLPGIYDPPGMFQELFLPRRYRDSHAGVFVG